MNDAIATITSTILVLRLTHQISWYSIFCAIIFFISMTSSCIVFVINNLTSIFCNAYVLFEKRKQYYVNLGHKMKRKLLKRNKIASKWYKLSTSCSRTNNNKKHLKGYERLFRAWEPYMLWDSLENKRSYENKHRVIQANSSIMAINKSNPRLMFWKWWEARNWWERKRKQKKQLRDNIYEIKYKPA